MNDIFAHYSVIHPRKQTGNRKRRRRNPETGELEHPPEPPTEGKRKVAENAGAQQDQLPERPNDEQPDGEFEESVEEPPAIQFVNFHGDNPIMSYKGQFYSCKWTSSIGSDLIFEKKPEDPDLDQTSLYSLPSWDLLDIGSARLIASTAQIDRRTPADRFNVSAPSIESEDVGSVAPTAAQRQTSFLTKLREIQISRGEVESNVPRGTIEGSRRRGGRGRRARRATQSTPESSRSEADRFSLSTPTPATWDAMDTNETG